MNLSPLLAEGLRDRGWDATHWSQVGDPRAHDSEIMDYARSGGYVLLTHDLDFGALLALTSSGGPSVVQVRTHDVTPEHLGPLVHRSLNAHTAALDAGALVTIDEARSRVRILPLLR